MPKRDDAHVDPQRNPATPGERRIRLPSGLAALETLVPEIESFCADQSLDASSAFALNVALDELVNNVVNYGLASGGEHFLEVRLRVADGQLWVEIEDDGVAFDPFDRPPPDTDLPLEERPIGGLGIEIVRQLMDEARYERQGDRNLVKLRRSLAAERE
jgi:anti-sigma regulatory factor (Ser/Thr protein kinase)